MYEPFLIILRITRVVTQHKKQVKQTGALIVLNVIAGLSYRKL